MSRRKTVSDYWETKSPHITSMLLNWQGDLKQGNIQAYEDLLADPFKCFWIYQNAIP